LQAAKLADLNRRSLGRCKNKGVGFQLRLRQRRSMVSLSFLSVS
jgi:hypothetical protein